MSEQAFKNVTVLEGIPVDEFMATMGFISAATLRRLLEPHELGLPLDVHAPFNEAIYQQALVFVLRIDQRVGKWTDIRTHVSEYHVRGPLACDPQVDRGHLAAAGDDGVGKADLAVQLERARLHSERTRRRARFRSLIDDPDADAKTSEPQC